MSRFTKASNGWNVDGRGCLSDNSNAVLSAGETHQARKFFEEERDAKYEVWRYPKAPRFVVKEVRTSMSTRNIVVVDEATLSRQTFSQAGELIETAGSVLPVEGSTFEMAAKAYLEAHPLALPTEPGVYVHYDTFPAAPEILVCKGYGVWTYVDMHGDAKELAQKWHNEGKLMELIGSDIDG